MPGEAARSAELVGIDESRAFWLACEAATSCWFLTKLLFMSLVLTMGGCLSFRRLFSFINANRQIGFGVSLPTHWFKLLLLLLMKADSSRILCLYDLPAPRILVFPVSIS